MIQLTLSTLYVLASRDHHENNYRYGTRAQSKTGSRSLGRWGEEIVIERNHQMVARILPGTARQTALEAMADLYRTLPEDAAAGWLESGRQALASQLDEDLRDPWVS